MKIQPIIPQPTAITEAKKTTAQPSKSFAAYVDEKLEASQPKNSAALYEELSRKYDVRHATFEEISELSAALYKAGEISLKTHSLLSFDYGRASQYVSQQSSGTVDLYETAASKTGHRNWINEYAARSSKNFTIGNLLGYENNKKVLHILEQLAR